MSVAQFLSRFVPRVGPGVPGVSSPPTAADEWESSVVAWALHRPADQRCDSHSSLHPFCVGRPDMSSPSRSATVVGVSLQDTSVQRDGLPISGAIRTPRSVPPNRPAGHGLSDIDERDLTRAAVVPTLPADITALRRVLAGVRSTACRQSRGDVTLRREMA